MSHKHLKDARLYPLLQRVDQDLANRTRSAGCRRKSCGGRLDVANYPRKPRGVDEFVNLCIDFSWRYSFCCAREGCRRRSTPPSVRFLGPKVYLGVVVMLITALRQGPTPPGAKKLKQELGVDRRTLKRWQQWWREDFPEEQFWKEARRRLFPSALSADDLPRALTELFDVETSVRHLLRCLRYLSPATARFETALHALLWPL
jgi:hypothetical protein